MFHIGMLAERTAHGFNFLDLSACTSRVMIVDIVHKGRVSRNSRAAVAKL